MEEWCGSSSPGSSPTVQRTHRFSRKSRSRLKTQLFIKNKGVATTLFTFRRRHCRPPLVLGRSFGQKLRVIAVLAVGDFQHCNRLIYCPA
jgi:hypothetical protein